MDENTHTVIARSVATKQSSRSTMSLLGCFTLRARNDGAMRWGTSSPPCQRREDVTRNPNPICVNLRNLRLYKKIICALFLICGLCGAVAAEQPKPGAIGYSRHTLTSGGYERQYGVYAPAHYTGKSNVPLVVILHGGGGSGWGTLRDTNWQKQADAATFLVAYPDGLARDPSKPGQFRGNPQTWNDGSGRFGQEGRDGPVDDVAFLDAMLDKVVADFAVDEGRVYVTGFSNGASMTFHFGERSKRRIAGIAPVAGECWSKQPKLPHPVPLCYVTGAADPLNPLGGGVITLPGGSSAVNTTPKPPVSESIARWCGALGEGAKPTHRETLGDNRAEIVSNQKTNSAHEVVVVTVPGLGHYWPGGAQNLPQAIAGPFVDTFDATPFIWGFFAQHSVD